MGTARPVAVPETGASRPRGEPDIRHPPGEEAPDIGPKARHLELGTPARGAALLPTGRITTATKPARRNGARDSYRAETKAEEPPSELPGLDLSREGIATAEAGRLWSTARQAVASAGRCTAPSSGRRGRGARRVHEMARGSTMGRRGRVRPRRPHQGFNGRCRWSTRDRAHRPVSIPRTCPGQAGEGR